MEDRRGRLSEATIWNLAFRDGESVIWPEADYDLGERLSAVVMNSWTPGIPLSRPAA